MCGWHADKYLAADNIAYLETLNWVKLFLSPNLLVCLATEFYKASTFLCSLTWKLQSELHQKVKVHDSC